jgi:hypothetical protein
VFDVERSHWHQGCLTGVVLDKDNHHDSGMMAVMSSLGGLAPGARQKSTFQS